MSEAERFDLMSDGVLKVNEAAAEFKLSRSKLYEMMKRGELMSVKVGKCRRIPRKALKLALASRVATSTGLAAAAV